MLKVNKYFANKFQKTGSEVAASREECVQIYRDLLQGCEEFSVEQSFDFDKKIMGLSPRLKRLMLSLKIMARDPIDPDLGREKALKHLRSQTAMMLEGKSD